MTTTPRATSASRAPRATPKPATARKPATTRKPTTTVRSQRTLVKGEAYESIEQLQANLKDMQTKSASVFSSALGTQSTEDNSPKSIQACVKELRGTLKGDHPTGAEKVLRFLKLKKKPVSKEEAFEGMYKLAGSVLADNVQRIKGGEQGLKDLHADIKRLSANVTATADQAANPLVDIQELTAQRKEVTRDIKKEKDGGRKAEFEQEYNDIDAELVEKVTQYDFRKASCDNAQAQIIQYKELAEVIRPMIAEYKLALVSGVSELETLHHKASIMGRMADMQDSMDDLIRMVDTMDTKVTNVMIEVVANSSRDVVGEMNGIIRGNMERAAPVLHAKIDENSAKFEVNLARALLMGEELSKNPSALLDPAAFVTKMDSARAAGGHAAEGKLQRQVDAFGD